MPVALLFFWKNTFSLIRSRLFLLAIIYVLFRVRLWWFFASGNCGWSWPVISLTEL